MKRLLCLLLALCLPMTALAETVAERIGVPEHVADTLVSNTGRTEITVDADIVIPGVSSVPLWEVRGTRFEPGQLFEAVRQTAPTARVEQVMSRGGLIDGEVRQMAVVPGDYSVSPCPGGSYGYLELESDGSHGRELVAMAGYWLHEQQQAYYHVELDVKNLRDGISYTRGMAYDIDGEGIPGNPLNTAEAIAIADKLVAALAPGFEARSVGGIHGLETRFVFDETTRDYDIVQNTMPVDGYQLAYTRTLAGLPVTYTYNWLNNHDAYADFGFPPGYEQICVVLDDQGVISGLEWCNPFIIGDQAAEDCELLPFERIWSIFEEIAPLSIMYQESEGDVRANVNRIELGYMPIRQQDGSYLLSPVWDFFGESMYLGFQRDYVGNSILTIDAITGFVIDRYFGY